MATRTDGTGVTTYAYHPVGGLGAGQLATVDGPLIDDTITYTCDQLGRVIVRAINSVGVTLAFDALGRVTSEVNVLGTFGYTYDGVSGRVAGVTHPNQQTRISTLLPQTAEAGRSCVLLVSLVGINRYSPIIPASSTRRITPNSSRHLFCLDRARTRTPLPLRPAVVGAPGGRT